MRVKICDIYNTKYFYITMGKDLNYMWNTCLALRTNPNLNYNIGNDLLDTIYACFKTGAPVEFDLAGAKITTDVTRQVIEFLRKGIIMCDSENPRRDIILKENMKRFSLNIETVPLPDYSVNTNVKDYITSLSTDVVYLPTNNNPEVYVPLIVMITILRPKVQICLDNLGQAILNFVANKLTVDVLQEYNDFYMVTPEGIQVVNKNDGIYVQSMGVVSLDEAMTVANFVPIVFGNERLFEDSNFRGIFVECTKMLNRYRSTRKRFLSDVLE